MRLSTAEYVLYELPERSCRGSMVNDKELWTHTVQCLHPTVVEQISSCSGVLLYTLMAYIIRTCRVYSVSLARWQNMNSYARGQKRASAEGCQKLPHTYRVVSKSDQLLNVKSYWHSSTRLDCFHQIWAFRRQWLDPIKPTPNKAAHQQYWLDRP